MQSFLVQPPPTSTLGHNMGFHHPTKSRKLGEGAGFADLSSFVVSWMNKILLFYVLRPKGFAPSHTVFQNCFSPALLVEVAAFTLEML